MGLIGVGAAAHYEPHNLFRLMHAVGKPWTRVLLALATAKMDPLQTIIPRFFSKSVVRTDANLTSTHLSEWAPHCDAQSGCPLMELSMRRSRYSSKEGLPWRPALGGQACVT